MFLPSKSGGVGGTKRLGIRVCFNCPSVSRVKFFTKGLIEQRFTQSH